MHKKKNSASVLAGEMILTFHKPASPHPRHSDAPPAPTDPAAVLGDVFDSCLANGESIFTSEAIFNRLVIELWNRRALNCLNLDRREFAAQLERRGWTYDPRAHVWSRAGSPHGPLRPEPSLFR